MNFSTQISAPSLKTDAVLRNSKRAADDISKSVANYVKLALVRRGKIATGKTLKSIEALAVLDSPSRGLFRRHVVGAKSWIYIQKGRKAGAKMPVRRVGKKFEPLPELVAWFTALNIPRARWFAILLAIKKRGIRAVDIRDKAVKDSRQRIDEILSRTAKDIARQLFQK